MSNIATTANIIKEIHDFIETSEIKYDPQIIQNTERVSRAKLIFPDQWIYHETYAAPTADAWTVVERPFVIFDIATEYLAHWPADHNVSFWRTSGKSNRTEDLKGTWFPTFGLMDTKDTELYGNPEYKNNIIKMQYVLHIYSSKYRKHGKFGPERYISKEIAWFLLYYNLYLWKNISVRENENVIPIMNQLIHKYNYVETQINTYFVHIWQILLSLRLAISNTERVGLWSDNFHLYRFMVEEWCPRYGIEIIPVSGNGNVAPPPAPSASNRETRDIEEYNTSENQSLVSFLKKGNSLLTISNYLANCWDDGDGECNLNVMFAQLFDRILENNRRQVRTLIDSPNSVILSQLSDTEWYPSIYSKKEDSSKTLSKEYKNTTKTKTSKSSTTTTTAKRKRVSTKSLTKKSKRSLKKK